jgi:non-ribosomal peptide synthetase component F
MIVGTLAVLKAGGAYLPLDPSHPKERVMGLLEDARASVLVTGRCAVSALPMDPKLVVALDPEGQLDSAGGAGISTGKPKGEDLAYVIYTSGSTGHPKGVEITHRGLLNLVSWHQRAFQITPRDRASLLSAPGFDAAVWEIWPYLTAGASIHLPNGVAGNDPEGIRDWILSQNITICFLPTPLAERVIALEWPTKASLRVMLTGADTLHHYPRRNLPFQLVNNYGPTECTVVATSGIIPPSDHLDGLPSIGSPIDNTRVFILNESGRQVPIGESGEIYIEGPGLARGYRSFNVKIGSDPILDLELIQRVKADDTPTEQIITGRAGAQIKELICKQAVWQITAERWLPGGSGKSASPATTEAVGVRA